MLKYLLCALLALFSTGCATEIPKSTLQFPRDGFAARPPGNVEARYPAVIILPTCGGVAPHLVTWADKLQSFGYATMIVDSFRPRGVARNCGAWTVTVDQVVGDVLAAQAYLRTLPYVDGERIGVLGFSYGAMAGLRLASAGYMKGAGPGAGVRAIVATYPFCTPRTTQQPLAAIQNNLYDDIVTPLLVLIGGADQETDPIQCEAKAKRLEALGQPISHHVYPGITHGFDQATMGSGTLVNRNIYRYDEAATTDATERVQKFFAAHLKQR